MEASSYLAWGRYLGYLGAALCIFSFFLIYREKKGRGVAVLYNWKKREFEELGKRDVTIAVIRVTMVIFCLIAPLCYIAGGDQRFTLAMSYLSFAGPSFAALIIGRGILQKSNLPQPLTELDFRYFYYGLPAIWLGLVGFVLAAHVEAVTRGVEAMVVISMAAPLGMRAARDWPPSETYEIVYCLSVFFVGLSMLSVALGFLL